MMPQDQPRLTLDSGVFSGRLRQETARSGYIRRPTPAPAARIDDIATQPAPLTKKPVGILQATQPMVQPKYVPIAEPTPLARVAQEMAEPKQSKPTRPLVLYAMASILFVVGLAVSLNGFHTNHVAQAQVKKLSQSAGSSGTNPPPSTDKPSSLAISSYQVDPDLPRYIDISSLNVHARVYQVGLTDSGALATPKNVYDTAWYSGSSKPGQAGAMLVDGHISSWTTHGVFYGLDKLVPGDNIKITRGDGTEFNYQVVKSQTYAADSVNMGSLMVSADIAKPGLNLISCSGDVIPGTNEFNKRIAVFAVEN